MTLSGHAGGIMGKKSEAPSGPHQGRVSAAKGDLGLSMTSRYAGRETMTAKAACVRAVELPLGAHPHHRLAAKTSLLKGAGFFVVNQATCN